MAEITQAARDFAADFWASYAGTRTEFSRRVRKGEHDYHTSVQAFQRAIDLGRAQALEDAAKVAEGAAVHRDSIASCHRDHTARYHNESRAMEARETAAAIRALKDRNHD